MKKLESFVFQLDIVSKLISSLLQGVSSWWKGLHHLSMHNSKQNHSGMNGKYILLVIMDIYVSFNVVICYSVSMFFFSLEWDSGTMEAVNFAINYTKIYKKAIGML